MRLPDNGRYNHPKIRSSSVRHFQLDEHDAGAAYCLASGDVLTDADAAITLPPGVVRGPTGKALRFSRKDQALWGGTPSDGVAAALGEWTMGALVRVRDDLPLPSDVFVFGLAGNGGDDGTSNPNYLASLRIQASGAPHSFWESSTGTNRERGATNYVVTKNEWTYIVWRKRDLDAGTCTLDLIINGSIVETFQGVTNAEGGADAVWRIGGDEASGSVNDQGNVDICGCYFWSEALALSEVQEDVRRIRGLAFDMRIDTRVEVDRAGRRFDLSELDGVDFVSSVRIERSTGDTVSKATVQLARESADLSLAPLRTESPLNLTDATDPTTFSNLVRLHGEIEIFAARVPLGLVGTSDDFFSVFSGYMPKIDAAKMTITAVDRMGRLLQAHIEETVSYGDNTSPPAVETVIQDLLDYNDNAAPNALTGSYDEIELLVEGTPTFVVKAYEQRREPVVAAIRQLAALMGWEIAYKFNQDPLDPGWRLTLFLPRRDRAVWGDCDFVLLPSDILDVSTLESTVDGRRTNWLIKYPSSETSLPTVPTLPAGYSLVSQGWDNVDGEGNRVLAHVHIQSDDALATLSLRQFAEISEASASQVDTITEATAMCLSALRDTDEVDLAKSIRIPALPEAELNDIGVFPPNRQLFTGQQRMTVHKIVDDYAEVSTSTIQTRGKPGIGFKRWLALESRNGRAGAISPNDVLADQQVTSLVTAQLAALERTRLMTGGKFLQIRNPSFEQFSRGLENFPDGWSAPENGESWGPTDGTDSFYYSTNSRTGQRSLRIYESGDPSGNDTIFSDFIPVDGDTDQPFTVEAVWQRETVGGDGVSVEVRFFDADKVAVGSDVAAIESGGVTTDALVWYRNRADGITPSADAKFARLIISRDPSGTAAIVNVDSVHLFKMGRSARLYNGVTRSWNTGSGWQNSQMNSAGLLGSFDHGNNTTISTGAGFGTYYEAKEPGPHRYTYQAALAESSAISGAIRVWKNAEYDANLKSTGAGSVVQQGTTVQLLPRSQSDLGSIAQTHAGIAIVTGIVELEQGDRLSPEHWTSDAGGIVLLGSNDTGVDNLVTFFDVKLDNSQ